METENSPQVHKHKGHKNKRSNSPDVRPNNEPQNNPVELPRNQSQQERTALIDDQPIDWIGPNPTARQTK